MGISFWIASFAALTSVAAEGTFADKVTVVEADWGEGATGADMGLP